MWIKEAFRFWQSRRVMGDKIAMCILFFGGIFLLWYELCHISSVYYPEWTTAYTVQVRYKDLMNPDQNNNKLA
jgi:hypothetical protein